MSAHSIPALLSAVALQTPCPVPDVTLGTEGLCFLVLLLPQEELRLQEVPPEACPATLPCRAHAPLLQPRCFYRHIPSTLLPSSPARVRCSGYLLNWPIPPEQDGHHSLTRVMKMKQKKGATSPQDTWFPGQRPVPSSLGHLALAAERMARKSRHSLMAPCQTVVSQPLLLFPL